MRPMPIGVILLVLLVVAVDPIDDATRFLPFGHPNLVLVTHHHGDHFDPGVLTAVAAYNRTADRMEFHPRGRDSGYLVEAAGTRVYISGDTEDIAEQADLGRIDAAFLCMNLPWTMSIEQAVQAVRTIRPTVLYPYHYRNHGGGLTDVGRLPELLGPEFDVDVRVLAWY